MHYGVREVEKLLRLPRSAINGFIKAGFVSPTRGPRKNYLFSFQDLIVLRTAQALAAAKVPARRIIRSLKTLRRNLPESMPLSGLAISAIGDRVVVKEGRNHWQADSGQYLLAFDGDPAGGAMKVSERPGPIIVGPQSSAEDWFEQGCTLERNDTAAARAAYEKAIAIEPAHDRAHINLGVLLHEAGDLKGAERAYRRALGARAKDAMLWYNFGVLLSDMQRNDDALNAYEEALRHDARMADAHYNMALLCEVLKKPKQAIRHMAQYRKLVRKP
jgi:tetratricopeptide (TPR) repeat protein